MHQLPVTKHWPCCRLSSVGGLYPPAVTVVLGSNELSLQPHFTSSLSGMLEGGSCPLPHMLHLFLVLAQSLHIPWGLPVRKKLCVDLEGPLATVGSSNALSYPTQRETFPSQPTQAWCVHNSKLQGVEPIWFRNLCAQEGKDIHAQKAHELGSSASVKTRERSVVAGTSGVVCVKSSKSYISGLGTFVYQCYVYCLHFFKVRKTLSSIVNPLSNSKYV